MDWPRKCIPEKKSVCNVFVVAVEDSNGAAADVVVDLTIVSEASGLSKAEWIAGEPCASVSFLHLGRCLCLRFFVCLLFLYL